MKIVYAAVLCGSLPAVLGAATAKQISTDRLSLEEASVARSAVEWYILRDANAFKAYQRMVLADSTAGPLTDTGMGRRKKVAFASDVLKEMGAVAGMTPTFCERISTPSPCGIDALWIGFAFSNPAIEGDTAIIVLHVFERRPPDSVRPLGPYKLKLVRDRSSWKVVAVEDLVV